MEGAAPEEQRQPPQPTPPQAPRYLDIDDSLSDWQRILDLTLEKLKGRITGWIDAPVGGEFGQRIKMQVPWEIAKVQVAREPRARRAPVSLPGGYTHRAVVYRTEEGDVHLESEPFESMGAGNKRFTELVEVAIIIYGNAPSLDPPEDEAGREPEEEQGLPQGSFGAGGWAPGGSGKYPRLTPDQAVQARIQFRELLLKRYHSVIRAWRALDRDGNGRLSIFEFMRGCQDLGVNNGARNLWDALDMDRSGYISLEEIDEDLARLLGSLAATIWVVCGSLDEAWDGWFNKKGFSHRVPKHEWIRACEDIGFAGDAAATFEALRSDLATVGVSRSEFAILDLWFAHGVPEARSPWHPKAEEELMARNKDDRDVYKGPTAKEIKETKGKAKEQFKKLLLESYGTFVRAWREGLDRDHSGQMDYKEFRTACQDVGFAGSRKVLWQELDFDGNGTVSLRELDEPTADMIEKIYYLAAKRYGSWPAAWRQVFDTRGDDRVALKAFTDGCRLLGWGGNPDRLFDLLDTDRTRYLTLGTTAWITGAATGTEQPEPGVPPEDVGAVMVSGQFRTFTKSQVRLADQKARDQRLRKRKFFDRARGEIPGSSVNAGSMHLGAAGFGQNRNGSEAASLSDDSSAILAATAPVGARRALGHSASTSALPGGGKEHPKSLDPVGLRRVPPVPDYLKDSPRTASLFPTFKKAPLDFPVAPQAPGKGGWPLKSHYLVDVTWGGEGRRLPPASPQRAPLAAAGQDLTASSPPSPQLTRSALSAPSLARWRESVTSVGGVG